MWDVGAQLRRRTERHEQQHGRPLWAEAWPWAEAMVAWHEQRRGTLPADRELVIAGCTESLRLTYARGDGALGDIPLGPLRDALHTWLHHGVGFPAPGSDGWPAPTGEHSDAWHTLMDTVRDGGGQGLQITHATRQVLGELCRYAQRRPHTPARLGRHRLRTLGWDAPVLADISPALGAGVMPVADLDRFAGAGELNLTAQPQ